MTRRKKRKWFPVLILLAGCATTVFLSAREEEDSLPVIFDSPLSVETLAVKKTDYRVRISAWGFVEPREAMDIRAEISGKIAHVPDSVFTGAAVKQNELLFSIDSRSYQNTLAEAAAAKKQALQALEIERGRQTIARTEWQLLKNSKWQGHKNKALALRNPQLKEREAAVEMAVAREGRAMLDVERTRVTAPCEGVILAESLADGRILDPGDVVARVACTDCYHLTAFFPPEYSLDSGVREVVVNVGPNRYEGIVKALLPQIDPETRRKQALVEFQGEGVPLGAYATLILPGPFFENVAVLPIEALRSGNTVWVLKESGTLEIRTVAILARDLSNVVMGEGIAAHEHVILSHIASPLQGMKLSMAAPVGLDPEKSGGSEEKGE